MSVVAKGGGGTGFEAPPSGLHPAKCIDVVDLGIVQTPFKNERSGLQKSQHQIAIVYQLHVEDDEGNILLRSDGKPYRLSRFYNLTLNEQANLRKDLESWRGKTFTDEDLANGFDVEKLIGVACQLNVLTEQKGDKTTAKITAVTKASRRDPEITIDPDFQREKDRPGGRDMRSPKAEQGEVGGQKQAEPKKNPFEDVDDDDLPF